MLAVSVIYFLAAPVLCNSHSLIGVPKVRNIGLVRCNGTSRNDSGIAVTVDEPNGSGRFLLPGDAKYTVIPNGTAGFDSVVVPHHGADMRNRFAPLSPNYPHSRVAYSYGPKNTFGHARPITRRDHSGRGWQTELTTETRKNGLGHIFLAWSNMTQPPAMSCSRSGVICNLAPTQV